MNSKFKKSISYESCSEFFIVPISKEQRNKLVTLLKRNPEWLDDLNKFQIPNIEEIYNWPFQINSKADKAKVRVIIEFIIPGRTLKQIEDQIQRKKAKNLFDKTIGNYLLQMTNTNHEIDKKKRIWRKPDLIKL